MTFNEELGALIQRYLDDPKVDLARMYVDLNRRASEVRVIAVHERNASADADRPSSAVNSQSGGEE
jgi:hypothetical protein